MMSAPSVAARSSGRQVGIEIGARKRARSHPPARRRTRYAATAGTDEQSWFDTATIERRIHAATVIHGCLKPTREA